MLLMNYPKKGDNDMRRRHRRPCGCHNPVKEIVHPVKENVVHCCSEETVKHVHPSHTTVMNHHLIKNEHVYPHSTSYQNTVNEVDVYGPRPVMGTAETLCPSFPKGHVAGAMQHGYGPYAGHHHHHKKWR